MVCHLVIRHQNYYKCPMTYRVCHHVFLNKIFLKRAFFYSCTDYFHVFFITNAKKFPIVQRRFVPNVIGDERVKETINQNQNVTRIARFNAHSKDLLKLFVRVTSIQYITTIVNTNDINVKIPNKIPFKQRSNVRSMQRDIALVSFRRVWRIQALIAFHLSS